jgi:hypothetical protein
MVEHSQPALIPTRRRRVAEYRNALNDNGYGEAWRDTT